MQVRCNRKAIWTLILVGVFFFLCQFGWVSAIDEFKEVTKARLVTWSIAEEDYLSLTDSNEWSFLWRISMWLPVVVGVGLFIACVFFRPSAWFGVLMLTTYLAVGVFCFLNVDDMIWVHNYYNEERQYNALRILEQRTMPKQCEDTAGKTERDDRVAVPNGVATESDQGHAY